MQPKVGKPDQTIESIQYMDNQPELTQMWLEKQHKNISQLKLTRTQPEAAERFVSSTNAEPNDHQSSQRKK